MPLKFNSLVPPFDLTGLTSVERAFVVATEYEGVDATGTTDSTKGLLKAIEDAWSKQKLLIVPSGTYKIGGEKTGVDLSTLPWPKKVKWETEPWKKQGTERIIGFSMDASAATFEVSVELGKNPAFNIAPPSGPINFHEAEIKLGRIQAEAAPECIGVRTRSLAESRLFLFGVRQAGKAVVIEQKGAKVYWGNNECFFYNIFESKETAITTESGTIAEAEAIEAPSNEISGNVFHCGSVSSKEGWGIKTDAATKCQTHANSWFVQAPEFNKLGGVLDHGGTFGQLWWLGIANANENADYELAAGAEGGGRSVVIGILQSAVATKLNGQPITVINGWVNTATFSSATGEKELTAATLNANGIANIKRTLIREHVSPTELPAPVETEATFKEKSQLVKGVVSFVGLAVGEVITGTKIPVNTKIKSLNEAKSEMEISKAFEGAGTAEVKELFKTTGEIELSIPEPTLPASVVYLEAGAGTTLLGLNISLTSPGTRISLYNAGTNAITVANNSAAVTTELKRFRNMGGLNLVLPSGQAVEYEEAEFPTIGLRQVTSLAPPVAVPVALKELKENTVITPSTTTTSTVYLSVKVKTGEKVAFEVIADGKAVYKYRETELAAGTNQNDMLPIRLKAAATFEVKTTVGKIESEGTNKSVYTVQEG